MLVDTDWSHRRRMPIVLAWCAHWEIIGSEVDPEQQLFFRCILQTYNISNILFYQDTFEKVMMSVEKNELEK